MRVELLVAIACAATTPVSFAQPFAQPPVPQRRGCPPAPALDNVAHTLPGGYGGTTYGGAPMRKRFVVQVADYQTHAPLPHVPVVLAHNLGACMRGRGCQPMHPHPPELLNMRGQTDANGLVSFDVPDLEYQATIERSPAGYLAYSANYDLGVRRCHDLSIQAGRVDAGTKFFAFYLVPERMVTVRSRAQAIALAQRLDEIQEWLPSHPNATLLVSGGPPSTAWQVQWAIEDRLKRAVLVNAFDGNASVFGRWSD